MLAQLSLYVNKILPPYCVASSHMCALMFICVVYLSWFHMYSENVGDKVVMEVPSHSPGKKPDLLSKNGGWGLKDSGFVAVPKGADENSNHAIAFTGSCYELGDGLQLQYFNEWVSINLGIQPSNRKCPKPKLTKFPSPIINGGFCQVLLKYIRLTINHVSISGFMQDLQLFPITFSIGEMDRIFSAYGLTLHDVTQLLSGTFPRLPDVVVWPGAPLLINVQYSLRF